MAKQNDKWFLFTLFGVSLHLLSRCELEIPERGRTIVYLYTLQVITSFISMKNYLSEIGISEREFRFGYPSLSEKFKAGGHLLFSLLTIGVTCLPEEHSHLCMVLSRSYCIFYITKWLCKKLDSVLVLVYSVLLYCTLYHCDYIIVILSLHRVTSMFRMMPRNQTQYEEIEKKRVLFCIDITMLMFVWYLRDQDGVSETDPFLNFLIGKKLLIDRIITLQAFFNSATFEVDQWKLEWNSIPAILLGIITTVYYCNVAHL